MVTMSQELSQDFILATQIGLGSSSALIGLDILRRPVIKLAKNYSNSQFLPPLAFFVATNILSQVSISLIPVRAIQVSIAISQLVFSGISGLMTRWNRPPQGEEKQIAKKIVHYGTFAGGLTLAALSSLNMPMHQVSFFGSTVTFVATALSGLCAKT